MTLPTTMREVYAKSTCLFSQDDINRALDKMAAEIHNQLSEENPILLCVMVGALIPAGHLLTRLDFPLELDYIHATR
ncbi:MAG: hypoxanthine-guanine phosphoribosyltransferase, partial [Gammaproteobacteria bacterium]|nr:hypoxanthine-guanine phosphoribosyltransferase [Gammaproteobacteria bacterium]